MQRHILLCFLLVFDQVYQCLPNFLWNVFGICPNQNQIKSYGNVNFNVHTQKMLCPAEDKVRI